MLRSVLKKSSILAGVLSLTSVASAADIQWSGFGSAYYGQAMEEELRPAGLSDKKADFTSFSLFGLNLGAKLDDNLTIASQLVTSQASPADPAWNLQVKWAYLNYRFNDAFSVKAGRQLLPFLMASEYESVRYLLPYRAIPSGIAGLSAFTGFDGVSAGYNLGLGESNSLNVTVFGGRPDLSFNTTAVTGETDELLGTAVTFDGSGYRVRASYMHANSTVTIQTGGTPSSITGNGRYNQASVGGRFDKYNVVVWGEYAKIWSDDGETSLGGDYLDRLEAGYVLAGYRIGKFLPRYTFQWADSDSGLGAAARSTSHTVGVNYELSAQSVFKLEYEQLHRPDDTKGPAFGTLATGSTKTDGGAIFAGIDFIF